jgi:hypothetical protein
MKQVKSYSHFHKASTCRSESCSPQQRPSAAPFSRKVQLALKTSMDPDEICTTKISQPAPDISQRTSMRLGLGSMPIFRSQAKLAMSTAQIFPT